MSFNVVKEDYWGTTTRCTIRERCKFMFNNELLSDVKFVVRADSQGGSESMKKIPAHKFVLAISSPVFFAMFYGELAETKGSVDISDCEYKSLLEFFRFVYSDEVNLDPDNVMQVLYLAKKYMLPSLADKCRFDSAKVGKGWHYRNYVNVDSIVVSVNKNINLHAVRLFGSENNEYSVTLKFYNCANGNYLATEKTGKFLSKFVQSEGGDYHGFDIVFEPPIALQAHTNYWFQAFITGPPSWYGQSGLSSVEHSGVTFSFTTKSGTKRTEVARGQFSDFEFTLN